jgi:hypothetical protein
MSNHTAEAQIFHQPAAEHPVGELGSETRIEVSQSVSKRGAATCLEILIGLFCKMIKFAPGNVRFEFAIPRVGYELFKPFRKCRELVAR